MVLWRLHDVLADWALPYLEDGCFRRRSQQSGQHIHLSDYNVTERFARGGSPWKKEFAKAYREQSPITYAGAITTPTLILHDTGDPRVPITNSYEMYHALKDNGVMVKFIAIPTAGHEASDPVHQSDTYRVWLEWLDQYLK